MLGLPLSRAWSVLRCAVGFMVWLGVSCGARVGHARCSDGDQLLGAGAAEHPLPTAQPPGDAQVLAGAFRCVAAVLASAAPPPQPAGSGGGLDAARGQEDEEAEEEGQGGGLRSLLFAPDDDGAGDGAGGTGAARLPPVEQVGAWLPT